MSAGLYEYQVYVVFLDVILSVPGFIVVNMVL